MIRVEYLKALDDGTWDTEEIEVPEDEGGSHADVEFYLKAYAREHLSREDDYQDVMYWSVIEWEVD